jgi:uncharacterized protein (DUF952 family)
MATGGTIVYHVTRRAAWDTAQVQGEYRTSSLDTDGFIHCSNAAQILRVANAYFRGARDLVLLHIDPAKLGANAPLRWEPPSHPASTPEVDHMATASEERFPHIYGPLPLEAIIAVTDLTPEPDGTFIRVGPG